MQHESERQGDTTAFARQRQTFQASQIDATPEPSVSAVGMAAPTNLGLVPRHFNGVFAAMVASGFQMNGSFIHERQSQ